ncbi:hypothetical protein DFH28DRAFT_985943 [Melampsora americana]|nr:hypothetical protein DFH28DRAFT_985943 [Melampsora americana]
MRPQDFVLPQTVEDWINLREQVRLEFHCHNSRGRMIAVILLMSSHILSIILFTTSAIWHTRTKDSTFSIRDSEGYIHPKTHTSTPCLVAIYSTLAFLALGSFSRELDICTASLHLVSVSGFLPTKPITCSSICNVVILTAYALPSRKYRFQTMSWSKGSRTTERHLLTPNQFNFIVIAGSLIPFRVIISFFFSENTSVPYNTTNNISKITKETQLLLQLVQIAKMGDRIAFYSRWTSGLFFVIAIVQTLIGMGLQIRILWCLFSRLRVLRDRCIQRQKLRAELPVLDLEKSFSISKLPIHRGQDENQNYKFVERESCRKYTRETKFNRSQLTSDSFDEKEVFEGTSDGITVQQQYIITRVYTVNLAWMSFLMSFGMISTILCSLATVLDWYDAPAKRTFLEALACGAGILHGILKIMLASSPVPVLPREPLARPITHIVEE